MNALWIATTLLAAGTALFLHLRHRRLQRRQNSALHRLQDEVDVLRQQLEELSSGAELRRQALFRKMVEGILVLDENRHVELINPTLQRLLGRNDEAHGRNILEIIRHPGLSELLDEVDRHGEVTEFELELVGEKPHYVQVNGIRVAANSRGAWATFLVFHDLTRLIQLENTRKEFVANVSHELRTPVSMIKGYVETLLEGPRQDLATQEKFLHIIEKHTNRLTLLIEDLLTLSQIEAGKGHFELHPISLRSVADFVCRDLTRKAGEKGVRLLNQIPDHLTVHADSYRIQQVYFNLIENAVKYGQSDSPITLGAGESDNGTIEAFVHNQGQAIPTKAQDRIFERFYRINVGHSRDQGGTGLGLSIVKHIIQAHGGTVRVTSRPGQGTTFFFTLAASTKPVVTHT